MKVLVTGSSGRIGRAATWVDETLVPQPRTIYHTTKLAAENVLASMSRESGLSVAVLS